MPACFPASCTCHEIVRDVCTGGVCLECRLLTMWCAYAQAVVAATTRAATEVAATTRAAMAAAAATEQPSALCGQLQH